MQLNLVDGINEDDRWTSLFTEQRKTNLVHGVFQIDPL